MQVQEARQPVSGGRQLCRDTGRCWARTQQGAVTWQAGTQAGRAARLLGMRPRRAAGQQAVHLVHSAYF